MLQLLTEEYIYSGKGYVLKKKVKMNHQTVSFSRLNPLRQCSLQSFDIIQRNVTHYSSVNGVKQLTMKLHVSEWGQHGRKGNWLSNPGLLWFIKHAHLGSWLTRQHRPLQASLCVCVWRKMGTFLTQITSQMTAAADQSTSISPLVQWSPTFYSLEPHTHTPKEWGIHARALL